MGASDSSLIDTTLQSTRDVNIKILYTEALSAAIIDSYLSMIYWYADLNWDIVLLHVRSQLSSKRRFILQRKKNNK